MAQNPTGFVLSVFAIGSGENISSQQYTRDMQNLQRQLNTYLQIQRSQARNSVLQTIGTGANTALSFDTNIYDISVANVPIHSTTVNPTRFTAPMSGWYQAVGQVGFVSSAAGGARGILVEVNGSIPVPAAAADIPPSTTQQTVVQVTCSLQLNFGDYVEFFVFQDSGGNLNTVPAYTWGSLALLSKL